MDNPFSYPSLAFGAESTQLGTELSRYNSFKNETEKTQADRDIDPTVPPTPSTELPPSGGGPETFNPANAITPILMVTTFTLLMYLLSTYDGENFVLTKPKKSSGSY
jgi:hypothetical protein